MKGGAAMKSFVAYQIADLQDGETLLIFPRKSLIYFVESNNRTSIIETCLEEHLDDGSITPNDIIYLVGKSENNVTLKVGKLANVRQL